MAAPEPTPGRAARYRDRLVDLAVLAIPSSLITAAMSGVQKATLGAPWKMLWVGLPLGALLLVLYRWIRRDGTPFRHWRWAAMFVTFVGLFSLLAAADVLRWTAIPQADQRIALRDWLLPLRVGDWRYWFARRVPADPDVLQVLLLERSASDTIGSLRNREAELIEMAGRITKDDAPLGMALDLYFVDGSTADARLCTAILAAGFPVISGYTRDPAYKGFVALPGNPPLSCQQRRQLGHLLGYADVDGRVRAQRLWFDQAGDRPSLPLLAAQAIMEGRGGALPEPPADNILRYLPPATDIEQLRMTQLQSGDASKGPAILQRRYLLVGLDLPEDRFVTPFGVLPGALIHAYAIHSLLTGHYISRPAQVWSSVLIFTGCLMLMVLAIQHRPARWLLGAAALLTVAVIVLAAVSMYFWLVWLDVVYATAAFWLWSAVLLASGRRLASRSIAAPTPQDQ